MRALRIIGVVAALVAALAFGGLMTLNAMTRPLNPNAEPRYFRVHAGESVRAVAERLEREGVIRNASAALLRIRLPSPIGRGAGGEGKLRNGTYQISAAQPADHVLLHLIESRPLRQNVLIREGLWAEEVASILEEHEVASAKEFMDLVAKPREFASVVSFPLPEGSLEGYLFPDTYDFPPLLGARRAIEMMLQAFEQKVYQPLGRPEAEKLRRWVVIGSLVELEAMHDDERRRIAGVMYNRLERKMRLQVDATVLYALRQRRRLSYRDYTIQHTYNTYLIPALPPGPICSPGYESIAAAKTPENHDFLYYVAKPDGYHVFSRTYQEHLRKVETYIGGRGNR
ncbi:MAG: endolytic transglycosylase MltG [Armatimonadota bacterium]